MTNHPDHINRTKIEIKERIDRRQAKCYNCKFASSAFKIADKTHHQCCHPKHEAGFENGTLSPWDTLQEFYNTCESHEFKPKRRSLNPSPIEMQKIKAIHLERLFIRTSSGKGKNEGKSGITPAMRLYGTRIGVNDWLEKEVTYLDKAKFNNNFER